MLYLIGWLYVNGAEQRLGQDSCVGRASSGESVRWLAGSAVSRLVAKMQAKALPGGGLKTSHAVCLEGAALCLEAHLMKSKGELAACAGSCLDRLCVLARKWRSLDSR